MRIRLTPDGPEIRPVPPSGWLVNVESIRNGNRSHSQDKSNHQPHPDSHNEPEGGNEEASKARSDNDGNPLEDRLNTETDGAALLRQRIAYDGEDGGRGQTAPRHDKNGSN